MNSELIGSGVTVLPDSPTQVKEGVLFSFDDVLIPFTQNLELTMETPSKYEGNPVLPRGSEGSVDAFGVQFYGSIVRDQGKFRLWYVAMDAGSNDKNQPASGCRPAYAESDDGINWVRPDLGLVEYRESKSNNLVLIEPAPLRTINLKVIVEPDDPDPARRYKMTAHTYWFDNGKKVGGTLVPLFSADGYRWTIARGVEPVGGYMVRDRLFMAPIAFEPASGLHTWKGLYYLSGQGHDRNTTRFSGRKVSLFRSTDFVDWYPTRVLGFAREGQYKDFPGGHGEEAHEGVCVWNRGNVLVGLYGMWHGAPDWSGITLDLGFLVSNDGIHFREPVKELVFLRRGEDGEWDQGGLIQGQGFENIGDKTYLWYGAWDPRYTHPYVPRGGLGLALLDRDRFGYLSPHDDEPASLVTNSVGFSGPPEISANVSGLSSEGWIEIELLDAVERPLAGSAEQSVAVVDSDGFRVPARWSRPPTVPARAPVKLRVTFCGAARSSIRLYALYFASR